MRLRSLLAAAVLAASTLAAHADPITYTLSGLSYGTGTATGTVTTDGNTGVLTSADITGFNIILSGLGQTQTITTSDLSFTSGTNFTASTSGLFFDFSGTDGGALIFDADANTVDGLCFVDTTEGCGTTGRYSSGPAAYLGANNVIVGSAPFTGDLQFASNLAVTPEPSSIALLGTGALGMAGLLRKRYMGA